MKRKGKNAPNLKKQMLLLFILCIALLLTSCRKTVSLNEDTAEQIIMTEFSEVLNYDENKSNPLILALYNGFNVSVEDIDKQKVGYSVNCTISNYDTKYAFQKMEKVTNTMELERFIENLANIMENGELISMNIKLPIWEDENGEYKTQFTEEQMDIALGGFLTYYSELMGE